MTLKIWGFSTTPQGSSGTEYMVTPRPSHFYGELDAGDEIDPGVANDPQSTFSACAFLELADDGTGHSIEVAQEDGTYLSDASAADRRGVQEIPVGGSELVFKPQGRKIRIS